MKNFSHMLCRIFYTFLIGLLFGVVPVVLFAQTELVDISPNDNGSVVLSFSALPKTISSELSEDKKRVTLTLTNTSAASTLRDELPTTKQIEHISVQRNGQNLTLYLVLRDKYGFTHVALPYSRTVHLSLVQWDKLSQHDNLYHSGLLSLESKQPETALEYLQQASQKGSGNAAAIAGLIVLQQGDIAKAQSLFTRAIDIGTSIPDVYAAISDIAAARGDTQRAQHFAQLFTRKTRLATFAPLVSTILTNQSEIVEPRTLAENLLNDEQPLPLPADSTAQEVQDSLPADSLLNSKVQEQAEALISTPEQGGHTTPPSLVPSWMQWTVYAFLFVFCAAILGVFYLYFRWRKKRLHAQKKDTAPAHTPSFEQEMASALQTAQAQKASALYKQADAINAEKHEEEQHLPNESLSSGDALPHEILQADDTTRDAHEQEFEFGTPEQHKEEKHTTEIPADADDVDALARKLRKGRGELDLAVKLLARKKHDGQSKALEISADDIPEKPSHLARLAQKLGIGAGMLAMRRQLGTAVQDDKEEKLRSLFDTSNKEK